MIRILYASRLVPEKWVDILINLIEYAEQKSYDIQWEICSDGQEANKIIELSKKYKNVQYHGKISRTELDTLYANVDTLLMPSRFLEMFGLTALEAIKQWTPVIGPRKWWLKDFIWREYELDEENPIQSFEKIIKLWEKWWKIILPDISAFEYSTWKENLERITENYKKILLVHDYSEKIWWAEYYLEFLEKNLQTLDKEVNTFTYTWRTSPWKRRLMFIVSWFTFWRGINLYKTLLATNPDLIWMHSILRYIWPWWIIAIRLYIQRHKDTKMILCHHDLWLLAAFPQDITKESDIPNSIYLKDFIPKNTYTLKKIISIWKWCYVRIIFFLIWKKITHMVFSSFLAPSIEKQFGKKDIIIFPHTSL